MPKFGTMEMVLPPSAHAGTLCQSLAPYKWLYHLQPTQAPYAKVSHHGNGYTTFSPPRHPMPKSGTIEKILAPLAQTGTL